MLKRKKLLQLISLSMCLMLILIAFPTSINAQVGTSFTYQGQLQNSGSMVTGSYDFQFTLYDAATNGSAQGTPVTETLSVSKGYFSTALDFGSNIFDGTSYWLEIAVRPAGDPTYTTLTQRQALTPSPYAIFAATIADASVTTSSIADAAVTPAKISTTGASNNQVLTYNGTSAVWAPLPGGGSQPTLFFSNTTGATATFPPLSTEVSIVSVNSSVEAGNEIKLDYSLTNKFIANANWSITNEIRIYRGATLIHTQIFADQGSVAGTYDQPVAGTYVDTAPATTTSTYEVRIITTAATNITSSSAVNSTLNGIIFTTP